MGGAPVLRASARVEGLRVVTMRAIACKWFNTSGTQFSAKRTTSTFQDEGARPADSPSPSIQIEHVPHLLVKANETD